MDLKRKWDRYTGEQRNGKDTEAGGGGGIDSMVLENNMQGHGFESPRTSYSNNQGKCRISESESGL